MGRASGEDSEELVSPPKSEDESVLEILIFVLKDKGEVSKVGS